MKKYFSKLIPNIINKNKNTSVFAAKFFHTKGNNFYPKFNTKFTNIKYCNLNSINIRHFSENVKENIENEEDENDEMNENENDEDSTRFNKFKKFYNKDKEKRKEREEKREEKEKERSESWRKSDYLFITFASIGGCVVFCFFQFQNMSKPFFAGYIPRVNETLDFVENKLFFQLASRAFLEGLKSLNEKNEKYTVHENLKEILENIMGGSIDKIKYLNTNFVFDAHHIMYFLPKVKTSDGKNKLKINYMESKFCFNFPIINCETKAVSVLRVTMKTTKNAQKYSKKITFVSEDEINEKNKRGKKKKKKVVEDLGEFDEGLEDENVSEEELEKYYKEVEEEEKEMIKQKKEEKRNIVPEFLPRFDSLEYDLDQIDICNCSDYVEGNFFHQLPEHFIKDYFQYCWPYEGVKNITLLKSNVTPQVQPTFNERLPIFIHSKDTTRGYLVPTHEEENLLPPFTGVTGFTPA